MLIEKREAPDLVGRRVWRILLVVWCCLIVYGSFIPFNFRMDPDFVRPRFAQLKIYPYQGGARNFSIPDVVSNILLFIPFGFLLSKSDSWMMGRSWALRVAASGTLALVFSTAIEFGQLFSPGRTSSGIDVEANVSGALLGASAAFLIHRFEEWVQTCVQLAHDEPRLVPIMLMAAWLSSDAFYPFALTLDVSTLWHNFTHARWIPFRESQRFLLDRVVDEAVMFAMLTTLVGSVLKRRVSEAMATITAVSAGIAFSWLLELGKLFFVGRSPNVENVLLASMGAILGVTLVPRMLEWRAMKGHPYWALAGLALALLAYSELTPFAFRLSSHALAARFHRIEWIPFLSYYGSDPESALFDMWKKLLLSGFWGFSFARLRGATPLGAARAGLVLGALLEAAQLLTVSRIPSVTDVLDFGLGAWIGGAIYRRYRERWVDTGHGHGA